MLDNELAPLYFPGNESNYGTIHDLLPEYVIFNKIFHGTLTPKRGDRSHINGSTRVLLLCDQWVVLDIDALHVKAWILLCDLCTFI
jgi:hypothetical protein